MRVGDAHQFQHALDRAVLAEAAMQAIERCIRGHGLDDAADIGLHVDGRDLVALPDERLCAGLA